MPVRLLNSSVLTWPNQAQVDSAVRDWAAAEKLKHPELHRLAQLRHRNGYFNNFWWDQ